MPIGKLIALLSKMPSDPLRQAAQELTRLQREVESLRAALMDPPADVQEAVIKKLGLVSGEGMDLLAQRDTEARRLLALARGVGEYGLGKEWVRDYEVWMGLPKETT